MNAIEFAPIAPAIAPAINADGRPLDDYELAEWAMDVPGSNPAERIAALVGNVLSRYGYVLDDAAIAALEAIRSYHAPRMWELVEDLDKANHAA